MTERTTEQNEFEDARHEELEQALSACQIRWVRGKVRVFEPGTTQKGKPKRDVSLSFPTGPVGAPWETIYHSIMGDNLDFVDAIIQHCDDRWTTVGIGEVETSSSPSKRQGEEGSFRAYHRTMNMVFLLPMNYIFDSRSSEEPEPVQPTRDNNNEGGEEEEDYEDHPF